MSKILALIVMAFLSTGCSTYYLTVSREEIPYREDVGGSTQYYITPGNYFIVSKKVSKKSRYVSIWHGRHRGYLSRQETLNPIFSTSRKRYYRDYSTYFRDYENRRLFSKGTNNIKSAQPRTREAINTLNTTNSSGRVQVKGYYRKDGTYVRPHTRSAPKRRN